MAGYDFNTEMAKSHEEHDKEFGDKPFTFGFIENEEKEQVAQQFYVRANVGYLGIKRVASLSEASSGGETFEAIEESVFSMIDLRDNALERFHQVVTNRKFPITFEDLVKLQGWLLEQQTALPPTEPQPSADSSSDSGPSSTDPSSTEQDAA